MWRRFPPSPVLMHTKMSLHNDAWLHQNHADPWKRESAESLCVTEDIWNRKTRELVSPCWGRTRKWWRGARGDKTKGGKVQEEANPRGSSVCSLYFRHLETKAPLLRKCCVIKTRSIRNFRLTLWFYANLLPFHDFTSAGAYSNIPEALSEGSFELWLHIMVMSRNSFFYPPSRQHSSLYNSYN